MSEDSTKDTEKEICELFDYYLLQVEVANKRDTKREHSVKDRLEKHKKWLDSDGQDGVRFQANNENFTGIDFSHKDIRKAEFKSCVLDYCNFYNANLGNAATFWTCSVKKSLFVNAQLENTQFVSCEISDCSFRNARFTRAYITGNYSHNLSSELSNNDLSGCQFKDSVITNFNLFGSTIDNAKIENTQFNMCDMSFLNFKLANLISSISMYKCKSIYINLSGKLIEGSSLVECDLTNSEFESTLAKRSDFSKSDLTRSNFRSADLSKSRLNMTVGENMNFNGADLHDSEMRLSSFRKANFYNCKLYNSDLSGSDLLGAQINDTTNKNLTNFAGCIWINGKRCKAGSVGTCYEEK